MSIDNMFNIIKHKYRRLQQYKINLYLLISIKIKNKA